MPDEYKFKIEPYTPDTMPMARLAEYMADLAALLGQPGNVHFVRIDPGSVGLVHVVEREAAPKVTARLSTIRTGDAAPDVMRAYREINRKLKEDNGSGALIANEGATIIEFPGNRAPTPIVFGPFNQEGTLDGIVIELGGKQEIVPVHIQSDSQVYLCHAKRPVAKRLAPHIFTTELRVRGTGRWLRDESGTWALRRFTIDDFAPLDSAPLSSVVTKLRAVEGSGWDSMENPWAELMKLRNGPDGVQ